MAFLKVCESIKTVIVICFLTISMQTPSAEIFNLLEIMEDAKPIKSTYKIHATIDSPYKAVKVTPYYYSRESKEIARFPEIEKIYNNAIGFEFQQTPGKNEYLILHITYGPHFVFERNSEAICFTSISGRMVVGDIRCDTFTTARFLIAAAEQKVDKTTLLTSETIERMIDLDKLPQTQSWQNYQAILTFFLNHVSEMPEYLTLNQIGQYLPTSLNIVRKIREQLLAQKRFTLIDFEKIVLSEDDSIVNAGYKVLIALNGYMERKVKGLEFVENHPTYVEDFYSGISPFTLSEPESMSLANTSVENGFVHYDLWPWFKNVAVKFDESPVYYTVSQKIKIPNDAKYAYLRPYSDNGQYLRTLLQVGSDIETEQVIQND